MGVLTEDKSVDISSTLFDLHIYNESCEHDNDFRLQFDITSGS